MLVGMAQMESTLWWYTITSKPFLMPCSNNKDTKYCLLKTCMHGRHCTYSRNCKHIASIIPPPQPHEIDIIIIISLLQMRKLRLRGSNLPTILELRYYADLTNFPIDNSEWKPQLGAKAWRSISMHIFIQDTSISFHNQRIIWFDLVTCLKNRMFLGLDWRMSRAVALWFQSTHQANGRLLTNQHVPRASFLLRSFYCDVSPELYLQVEAEEKYKT